MIYQLRLPIALGLDGLFQQMILELELALACPLTLELKRAVACDLEKHLLALDTCGCSSLCDEATSPSKWNQNYEPFLLSMTNEDRDKVQRLTFNLPGDSLDRLAGGLARYLDQHIPGMDAARRSAATAVIFNSLAPYTFYGEICRKIDLCKSGERLPLHINIQAAP